MNYVIISIITCVIVLLIVFFLRYLPSYLYNYTNRNIVYFCKDEIAKIHHNINLLDEDSLNITVEESYIKVIDFIFKEYRKKNVFINKECLNYHYNRYCDEIVHHFKKRRHLLENQK